MHRPTPLTRIPAALTLLLATAGLCVPARVADPGPTETLFVLDLSESMAGPSIRQARAVLLARLARLGPQDRFNILGFHDGQTLFRREFRPADAETRGAAQAWLAGLRTGGGTMTYPAVMRGLELLRESRFEYSQRVVFLTDGAMADEQELLRALGERRGAVRLHTIGIGHAPNAQLLQAMARLGDGTCTLVPEAAEAVHRGDASPALRQGDDRSLRLVLASLLAAVGLTTLSRLGLGEDG